MTAPYSDTEVQSLLQRVDPNYQSPVNTLTIDNDGSPTLVSNLNPAATPFHPMMSSPVHPIISSGETTRSNSVFTDVSAGFGAPPLSAHEIAAAVLEALPSQVPNRQEHATSFANLYVNPSVESYTRVIRDLVYDIRGTQSSERGRSRSRTVSRVPTVTVDQVETYLRTCAPNTRPEALKGWAKKIHEASTPRMLASLITLEPSLRFVPALVGTKTVTDLRQRLIGYLRLFNKNFQEI
ncbi:hypothetical protein 2 [Beihai barnacle virus 7]|uniref:Uncharacterized protein n=1 Tax=Beihai barnacle virus 7 TaxID=1922365 RepID=A0A1L3KML6_9RHAB|nr:hypothetical protein 2 [Beihai barnacle virus 7]APG78661.1 hypothetical protein 2 [Beihai barnacle virus 7]